MPSLVERDIYAGLTDKAKDVASKIEPLLNGLTSKEVNEIFYAVIEKSKEYSIISFTQDFYNAQYGEQKVI